MARMGGGRGRVVEQAKSGRCLTAAVVTGRPHDGERRWWRRCPLTLLSIHNRVWTVAECAAVFFECIRQGYADEDYRNNIGTIPFDKDDKLALDFVTAAMPIKKEILELLLINVIIGVIL